MLQFEKKKKKKSENKLLNKPLKWKQTRSSQCLPIMLTWHQNGSDGPPVSSPGHLLSVRHKHSKVDTFCNFTVLIAGWRSRVSHVNLASELNQTQCNGVWYIGRGKDRHNKRETDRELITHTMAHFTMAKYLCVRSQIEPTPDTCCPRLIITHTAKPGEPACVCVCVCAQWLSCLSDGKKRCLFSACMSDSRTRSLCEALVNWLSCSIRVTWVYF